MPAFRIRGELEVGVSPSLPTLERRVRVRHAIQVRPTLRDDSPAIVLDVADDDLLEVELESGITLWTTIHRLREDAASAGLLHRDVVSDLIPSSYPLQRRGTERGAVGDAIRAVRVLGVDLPKRATERAVEKIESKLAGDGQFFRINIDGNLSREDIQPTAPDEPTLLLIHGTFSSTQAGYIGLFNENKGIWHELHEHYSGRIYGFDHRTLSKGPIDNALQLLRAIPQGANLHIVTHSRGGLVGDLVAHGQVSGAVFDRGDVERELLGEYKKRSKSYEKQLERYLAFNEQIAEVAPNVTRYVRVACPAAGTTLASKRLDIYLSILINLLDKVPGIGPLLGALGDFVAAVAKERTDVDVIPGLKAQMPTSPFIRLLNASPHVLDNAPEAHAAEEEEEGRAPARSDSRSPLPSG